MKGLPASGQRGFVLVLVVVALGLVAGIAFLLNREGAVRVRLAASEGEVDAARYVAEAGLHHARWRADQSACTGYTDLPATDFGGHSYSAAIDPDSGSPVAITASGKLASGASRTLRRDDVAIMDTPRTVTLQPGRLAGKDTRVRDEQPDANYGDAADLVVDPGGPPQGEQRALLEFDLEGLSAKAVIDAAELSLYLYDDVGDPVTVQAHRLTGAWAEGTGAGGSGATWNERDAGDPWTTPGGDYDPAVVDSYTGAGTGWKTLDLAPLVQGWVDGVHANQGVILAAAPQGGIRRKHHYSSDSAQCALRPKLTLTYRCECGACDFPKAPAPICGADYVPDGESGSFSTADIGAGDVWGLTFLPDCVAFNGASAPLSGAWLLVDTGDKKFRMTDVSGAVLSTLDTPTDHMRDAAYVQAGPWRGHLAVTEENERRVYFLDLAGAVQGMFSTDAFTERPVGLGYIGRTASGAYENHLAISSDKDQTGSSNAAVYIVDQAGILDKTIDVSALAPEPWGVVHLAGTDKLMVAAKGGSVFIIDFDGNLLDQYDAGALVAATQIQGIAVNPMTCEHVISDHNNQTVFYLGDT